MLDFKEQNDKERAFFEKDFSCIDVLMKRVRNALVTGEKIDISDLDFSGIIDYNPSETLVYITLFQSGQKFVRYGSKRVDFQTTVNRNIEMIRKNQRFSNFNPEDENLCRIMIEYTIDRKKVRKGELNSQNFDNGRFEIGINGLELRKDNISYYYMPTDAISLSHMGLRSVLQTLVKKTPIGKLTNSRSERLKILAASNDYEYYLFRSRAFVTYRNTTIPLYRGNIRYTEFSYDVLYHQIITSAEWLLANMYDDGRFLYYYDCCEDNYKDHEHPTRPEDNLYYNDLLGNAFAQELKFKATYEMGYDKEKGGKYHCSLHLAEIGVPEKK